MTVPPGRRGQDWRMGSPFRYSRRAFIGMAAGAAAGAAAIPAVTAGCRSAGPGGTSPGAGPAPSRRGPVPENSLPGDPHWDIRHLGPAGAMLGYAGDLARRVWRSGTVTGHRQREPEVLRPARTVEARWEPSLTIPTHDWPEGSYLLRMDSEEGAQRFAPVTVRSAKTAGKTVIKNSVETWQAYNLWGGYNLYNGPGGATDYNNRSLAVSLDRPYDRQGAFMFLYHEGSWSSWPNGSACRWPTSPAWTSRRTRTCWTGPVRCSRSVTTNTGHRRSGPASRPPGTPG